MIFKNILLLSAMLIITVSLTIGTSYATSHGEIDQINTSGTQTMIFNSGLPFHQTFTPTVDNLIAVDYYIVNKNAVDVTQTLTVAIKSPLGEIGRTTQTVVLHSGINQIRFDFPTPLPIISGELNQITIWNTDRIVERGVGLAYNPDSDSYLGGYANTGFCVCGDFSFATYYERTQTPEEQTQTIVDDVFNLLTTGDISQQSANSLTSTLENAIGKIEDGNTTSATGMLGAFINKVEQMIQTGKISPENGQALIDAANNVINSL